jgi:type II secretory pathway pseudopilin PulG
MIQRNGFSLLVAIFTIMLISLVAAYIFFASSATVKEGGLQYKKEQAQLLARSYTEYAIMAISANNRAGSGACIDDINATIGNDPTKGQGFRVQVKITYIGNSRYVKNCTRAAATLSDTDIDTLSAIIDVYVEYKDMQYLNYSTRENNLIPWKSYHKRSLQKI